VGVGVGVGVFNNYKAPVSCTSCGEAKDGFVCYHHVKTRKSGGTDEPHNLMPLCSWCHTAIHKIGLVSMSKKNSKVHNWLLSNGWELVMGKWVNGKMGKWIHSKSEEK